MDAWTAVPSDAAIPALRGNFCRDSQYILGHVSYLFQAEGDSM